MKRMMHAESLSGTKASLLCLLLLLTMSTKAFSQIADKRTYLSDVLVEMHTEPRIWCFTDTASRPDIIRAALVSAPLIHIRFIP